jgi:hypothetical protein
MSDVKLEIIELGVASEETKGVFSPNSFECSTQAVDSRDK